MNCSLKWNGRHSSSRALKWDASSHARSRSALTRAHAGGTRMRAARAPPFQHGMARGALLPTPSPGSSFFHAHSRDTRFSIRVQGVHGGGGGGAPTVCCPCVAGWPPQPTKGGDSGLCKEHSKRRRGATMPKCDSNGFLRRVRVRMGVETNATPLCYLRARAWRSNHVVCEVRKRGGFVGTKTNNITHRTQPGLSNRNMRCAQIMESGTGGVLHRSNNLSRRGKGGLSAQEREVCLIVKTTRVNLSMGSSASGAEKDDSNTGRPKRGAPANLAGCERRAQCRPSHALRMVTGSQPPPHPNMTF